MTVPGLSGCSVVAVDISSSYSDNAPDITVLCSVGGGGLYGVAAIATEYQDIRIFTVGGSVSGDVLSLPATSPMGIFFAASGGVDRVSGRKVYRIRRIA